LICLNFYFEFQRLYVKTFTYYGANYINNQNVHNLSQMLLERTNLLILKQILSVQ